MNVKYKYNDEKIDFEIYKEEGENKVKVNKTAYILTALLLGGVGVHKFIAGKAAQGILMLLFCWTFIPAIIAFIEAICAAGKKTDEYGNITL